MVSSRNEGWNGTNWMGDGNPYGYLPDQSKTPLGRGEFDQQQITGINDLQGQYGSIWDFLQQGFDPMVRNQLNNLPGLQQQMLGGGKFGGAEEQTYRDMVSGKTLAGQGGTIYDMIQQQFSGARNDARGYAASRGLSPTSGAAMGYEGQVAGDQQKSFAEQMVKQYLNMVGTGSEGLGAMDLSSLQRQQAAGGLGQWMSQFVEGSQQGRMGIGLQATQMQQNPLMQMLGLSQNQNIGSMQNQKPSGWETAASAAGAVAPYFFL